MDRQAVRSKDIAIVGYDSKKNLLEVTFRAGGVYHYMNVPVHVYQKFIQAESQGTFFNREIKDAYPYIKIS